MRTLLAVLLLSSAACGQIVSQHGEPQIIAAYDTRLPIVIIRPQPVVAVETIELTMYSLPGGQCPACVTLKRELSAVSWVRIVEPASPPQWVSRFPTIVWNTESGSQVKLVGWDRGDVRKLKRALKKHNRKLARLFADTDDQPEPADAFAEVSHPLSVPRQPVSVSRSVSRRPGPRWNYNGRWNVSRSYAANHLSSAHGIDPTGLTKQQIDILHDNAHNGYRSSTVAMRNTAYCPTCPR